MITAHEVQTARFRRAAPGAVGYDEVSVDDFLDRVVATLDAIEHGAPVGPNGLTSAEVVDTVFAERSAQVNGGYDLDDVDDLLDRVAQRLFGHEQQTAPRSTAEVPAQRDDSERVAVADDATAGFPDEGYTGVDDGGVADARALADAEAGDSLVSPDAPEAPTETAEADLDSRESDVAGAAYTGMSFAAEGDATGVETAHDRDVEEAQAGAAEAESFESRDADGVAHDEVDDERPMHVIFDSADSREPSAPHIVEGGDASGPDGLSAVGREDNAERDVETSHAFETNHEPGSESRSGGVNPVGADPVDDADPVDESSTPSSGHAPHGLAADDSSRSEDGAAMHLVGSSVDDSTEPAVADVDTDGSGESSNIVSPRVEHPVVAVPAEGVVTPEERFDASRRDDVVSEPVGEERTPLEAHQEFEPADVPRHRAADEVGGSSDEEVLGDSVDDGFDPFGADVVRPQGDSPVASTVGESWSFESFPDEPSDSLPPVGLTSDDQSEPEVVSYRATDHRVPLPRGDVRSHLSDADLEAESHYHPEFSTYAGQSDGVDGAADTGALAQEPVAPESSMPAPEVEPEIGERDAREDVEVRGHGLSGTSDPAPTTPVEPLPPQVSGTGDAGRSDEQDNYTPTHFVERTEPSAVPAMRDVTPMVPAEAGIGRPEPIDRPSPIDVDEPEAIERPSALPPRDDTSRKGILRRIFKG